MRRLLNKSLVFLLCVSLYFANPFSVSANENFETHLKTTYSVNEKGEARVSHDFRIINKTPLYFITQYGLKVSSNSLAQITVTSEGKRLEPEITTTKNETSIGITFPDEKVGQNKERVFTISYQNPDATVVSGNVLEIYVPQLSTSENYASYTLILQTPIRYGAPSRLHPATYTTTFKDRYFETRVNDAGKNSLVAVFGQEQYFKLAFRSHLENPTNGVRLMQIALPPDTAYQKVQYHALEPQPEKIETDADGNWVATYRLAANTSQIVNAEASIRIGLTPDRTIPVTSPTDQLLNSDEYWPTQNTQIRELASNQQSVKDIYQYLLTTLDYDYDRLEENPVDRLGAAATLAEPHRAMCQEYTDLFITLSRAKGIPARRATGYAYTENDVLRPLSFVQDTLHAWPEYFDRATNQWVPIDPTWEDTSGGINYFDQFDLNHIVFAYNGHSSSLPLPAGSYKTTNIDSKDIDVQFTERFTLQEPDVTVSLTQPKISSLPLSPQANLLVINTQGQAFYNLPVTIGTQDLVDWQSQTHTVKSILPFQTATLPVRLISNSWWQPQKVTLEVSYGDHTTQLVTYAAPRIVGELTHPYVLLSVGIGVTVLTLGTWSLLVFREKRRSAVRRKGQKP